MNKHANIMSRGVASPQQASVDPAMLPTFSLACPSQPLAKGLSKKTIPSTHSNSKPRPATQITPSHSMTHRIFSEVSLPQFEGSVPVR